MSTGVEGNEDISVNVDLIEKGLSEKKTQNLFLRELVRNIDPRRSWERGGERRRGYSYIIEWNEVLALTIEVIRSVAETASLNRDKGEFRPLALLKWIVRFCDNCHTAESFV